MKVFNYFLLPLKQSIILDVYFWLSALNVEIKILSQFFTDCFKNRSDQ